MSFGILDFGAYIPHRRLQRQAIHKANGWFAGGLKGLARGERAVASWDEDSVTMAVEAARACLGTRDRAKIDRVILASTSHPFADRQNAAVIKEALVLDDAVASMDMGGGLRAGLSALSVALASPGTTTLCLAAEKRFAAPASESEMNFGDAAAAFLVGAGDPVAVVKGSHSVTVDFVDHFRASGAAQDYGWESRWVRDEGYAKIGAGALVEALNRLGIAGSQVDHLVVPITLKGVPELFAKKAGIAPGAIADSLGATVGDSGAAHAGLLLAATLEKAKPGETIVVVAFGQGCDVLVLETTAALATAQRGVFAATLGRRTTEENYLRHLWFNGSIAYERGMRAEQDMKTALTALYRNRRAVLGLVGGKCSKTGTVQFPASDISVNQNDPAIGTQEDYPLADIPARIVTFTADALTYSPDPPSWYGMVEFEGGGRMMAEFADVAPEDVEVGRAMRMVFRVKAIDEQRDFKRYFWKAVPATAAA